MYRVVLVGYRGVQCQAAQRSGLDQLREELLAVVQETMQLAPLSLWIRLVKQPTSARGTRGESLFRLEEQPGADPSDSR